MKSYSKGAFGFIVLGMLLIGFYWGKEDLSEPVGLIGFLFLLLGVAASFTAIAKQEPGKLAYISLLSCFMALFLFTWIEPFLLIRLLTWLKNR